MSWHRPPGAVKLMSCHNLTVSAPNDRCRQSVSPLRSDFKVAGALRASCWLTRTSTTMTSCGASPAGRQAQGETQGAARRWREIAAEPIEELTLNWAKVKKCMKLPRRANTRTTRHSVSPGSESCIAALNSFPVKGLGVSRASWTQTTRKASSLRCGRGCSRSVVSASFPKSTARRGLLPAPPRPGTGA